MMHGIAYGPVAPERDVGLDAFRSLAIVLVLLSHGRHFLTPVWEQASVLRIGGFLGVELFFVLSGFLVGRILQRNFLQATDTPNWLRDFLFRRWLRTLPLFYLFLLVNALLIAWKIAPGNLHHLAPLLILAQNLAWTGPAEFGEAWSLSVEGLFYLLLPVCLLLGTKLDNNRKRVFIQAVFLLLLAPLLGRLMFVALDNPTWDEGVRKIAVLRLDALMTGVLAGWLVTEWRLIEKLAGRILTTSVWVSLTTVVAIYFFLEPIRDSSQIYRVILFPMTSCSGALLLLAVHNKLPPSHRFASSVKFVARRSYALYLGHMPVIYCINYFLHPATSDPKGALTRWLLFFAGSILVASVAERWVESPILIWRDRVLPH